MSHRFENPIKVALPEISRDHTESAKEASMAEIDRAAAYFRQLLEAGTSFAHGIDPRMFGEVTSKPDWREWLKVIGSDQPSESRLEGLGTLSAQLKLEIEARYARYEQNYQLACAWLAQKVEETAAWLPGKTTADYEQWLNATYREYERRFPAHRQANPDMTGAAIALYQYRRALVDHRSYELLKQVPFKVKLAFPDYLGNLSEKHSSQDGKLHIIADEQLRIGRIKREPGQTLGGKRKEDFHCFVAVVPGDGNDQHWGQSISFQDIKVVEKTLGIQPAIPANDLAAAEREIQRLEQELTKPTKRANAPDIGPSN